MNDVAQIYVFCANRGPDCTVDNRHNIGNQIPSLGIFYMDIFVVGFVAATECFVKVNSHPFLFQVDLAGEIDTKESSGVVNQNGVHFFLVKVRLLMSIIMLYHVKFICRRNL